MSKILHQYFSTFPSLKYIFKDGKDAAFVLGKYVTDNPRYIAELDAEIAEGHPHISKRLGQETIDSDMLNPENALRAKYFAEFQAQQALNPNRDMGQTKQEPLRAATSRDMAAIAAGGSGAAPAYTITPLDEIGLVKPESQILQPGSSITPSLQEKLASLRNRPAEPVDPVVPMTSETPVALVADSVTLQTDPALSAPNLDNI